MDLGALTVFDHVVRHGTFTAAARALSLSPSSVSRQIAALEEQIGVRLFERTTRTMSLTEAGRRFAAGTKPALEELERAAQRARDAQDVVAGAIRVATSAAFAQEHFVPWLAELRTTYPELRIELLLDSKMSDLIEQRVDVAVRLGAMRSSTLIATKLCEMRRVVVASPDYLATAGRPKRPTELQEHACLAFPFDGFGSTWLFRDSRGRRTQVAVDSAMVVPDGAMLRELAVRGMGVSLLPRWLVAHQLRDGTLVDVFPKYDATGTVFDTAVWLVFPSRDYLPVKVRAFLDFMKAQFLDGPPWERHPD